MVFPHGFGDLYRRIAAISGCPASGRICRRRRVPGNIHAVIAGVVTLVLTIILLDQLLWRPILAWAEKFKVEMVAGEQPPNRGSGTCWPARGLVERFARASGHSLSANGSTGHGERCRTERDAPPTRGRTIENSSSSCGSWQRCAGALGLYGTYRAALMLRYLHGDEWAGIGVGTLATLLRVTVALMIALSLDASGRRSHRHQSQAGEHPAAGRAGDGFRPGDRAFPGYFACSRAGCPAA